MSNRSPIGTVTLPSYARRSDETELSYARPALTSKFHKKRSRVFFPPCTTPAGARECVGRQKRALGRRRATGPWRASRRLSSEMKPYDASPSHEKKPPPFQS